MPDRELLGEIRGVLAESPFVGEGHRKVWARLRRKGIETGRKRVLRLTRERRGCSPPTPQLRKRAKRLHDGTITVTVPDTLWATDATDGHSDEGRCAVFLMIDHASGEAWADTGLRMDRFAAADLLREVTTERFGSVEAAVASGLALRYDGGPCFRSDHYQAEIDHLGIARSPAYHYEPETNGCAEKFIQTLKEQLLWIERFETFEALRKRGARVRPHLQRRVAARAPRLPHAGTGARAADPSGHHGTIALFTKVSDEPGRRSPSCGASRGAEPARSPSVRTTPVGSMNG